MTLHESLTFLTFDSDGSTTGDPPANAKKPKGLCVVMPARQFDWSEQLPMLREARDAFERAYLLEVLRRVRGNVSAAARVAGRNRTDIYDLFKRHQIDPVAFRTEPPAAE